MWDYYIFAVFEWSSFYFLMIVRESNKKRLQFDVSCRNWGARVRHLRCHRDGLGKRFSRWKIAIWVTFALTKISLWFIGETANPLGSLEVSIEFLQTRSYLPLGRYWIPASDISAFIPRNVFFPRYPILKPWNDKINFERLRCVCLCLSWCSSSFLLFVHALASFIPNTNPFLILEKSVWNKFSTLVKLFENALKFI